MKKILMTWVVAVFAVLQAQAQSSVIALLSHEGNVTTFNGATALQKAHEAAVNGDVITLSSGTFHSVDITKGVTVRGAGMLPDTLMGTEPTVVSGDFTFNMAEAGDDAATSFEGIQFNNDKMVAAYANNVTFNKCILHTLTYENSYGNSTMNNLSFIHCRIWGELSIGNNGNAICRNCFVRNPRSYNESSSNFEFTNCVIYTTAANKLYTSILNNCVFIDGVYLGYTGDGYRLPETNTVSYTLASAFTDKNGVNPLANSTTSTSWTFAQADVSSIFKTYTGTYDNYETFELTESAAATYIGSDGTQVGMYGGSTPYTATPSVSGLQVTKFQVAPKSDSEGRLSIDIEVKTAE